MDKVLLTVGSGGKKSLSFIKEEILKRFSNERLNLLADGAHLDNNLVITTDTFTVYPPFFEGGNIGVLSMCGMINDLASMAAEPYFMTMGLVIEEGFPLDNLNMILDDMQKLANKYSIILVAGDTKVVEKGKLDGIHINITGIGKKYKNTTLPYYEYNIGDGIILTGSLGEHSIAVLKGKGVIEFDGYVPSDVAPLWEPVKSLLDANIKVKFIRDVTRGGLSAILNEFAIFSKCRIEIEEKEIPVNEKVSAICDIYGFDIYNLACEGRIVIVVDKDDKIKALEILRKIDVTKDANIVGEIIKLHDPLVLLRTLYGGSLVLDMPVGEILPRIC